MEKPKLAPGQLWYNPGGCLFLITKEQSGDQLGLVWLAGSTLETNYSWYSRIKEKDYAITSAKYIGQVDWSAIYQVLLNENTR